VLVEVIEVEVVLKIQLKLTKNTNKTCYHLKIVRKIIKIVIR